MGIAIPQVITEDIASGAQVIDGSLKFNSSATNYLKKTPIVAGNRKTWTISFWVKRYEGSATEPGIFSTYAGVSGPAFTCYFNSSDKLRIYNDDSGYNLNLVTAQVFRDYNSWYHIVISIDTTQTTASDKAKLYVNGVRVTEFSTEVYPGDIDLDWNTATEHNIGRHVNAYDGNISNFYSIDGQALGPEEFGFTDPLTNTWRPKKYTGNFNNLPDIGLGGISTNPNSIDVVINRQVNKAWIKNTGGTGNYAFWKGGGDPSDPSSEPSFYLPSGGNLYWFTTAYDSAHTMIIGSLSSETGTQPEWDSSGTTGSLTRDSATQVSGTPSSSYASARTEALADNTVYAFTFSINTGALGNHTGWFLSTSSSYSTGTPDEQTSGNTVGARYDGSGSAYYDYVAVYGTFATLNPNTMHNSIPKLSFRGVNSFYLPFDGNSRIGEDKSGRANNWKPVNFGGSNTIEKATGALPILNTVSGGNAATVGVRTDAFASNLVLALPLVDTVTDASGDINSAVTSKIITPNQNAAPANDGQGMFYGVSVYLDGSDDYVETSNSSDFVVGTGDFTIEAWYNVAASQGANPRLFGQNTNNDTSWDCYLQGNPATGTSAIKMHGNSVDLGMSFPSANAWHHFCIARKNGTLYSFMNGVLKNTQTYTNSVGSDSHGFRVGDMGGSGGYGLSGYVQDFRFYKGVAKYTSDFIPASTNPDILPDTPSGVSGSSKLVKIVDGSVGFAGTSRLSIANSSETELGTDPFTMEAWVYKNSDSANPVIASKYVSSSRSWYWSAGVSASDSNQAFYYYYGINGQSGAYSTQTGGVIPVKKWTHCAVSRDSNDTIRLFIDGKHTGTINITDSNASATSTPPMELGMDSSNADGLDGMISNFRFVKGTALYTSDFTPPTEPLTNITNTKLLCAQSRSEHKDITGRLYKSGTLYTTRANIVANATPLEGGETLSNEYLYYVPSGNELTRQQIFSADGAITNSDSINGSRWGWLRHDGTNWVAITGSYGTGQFDEFYFDADDTALQLDQSREFYALRVINGTVPEQNGGTAPTLRKQFVLDAAVIPFNGRRLIDQLYEPTVSNFNPFTTDINTVRGQETTYATLNPLATQKNGTITLSDGNLRATVGATRTSAYASLPFVGKMYYEVTYVVDRAYVFGMAPSIDFNTTADTVGQRFIGESSGSYGVGDDGTVYNNGVSNYQGSSLSDTFGLYDCMGWAYDSDSGQFSVYKNGKLQGTFTASTSRTYYPAITLISSSAAAEVNFGQKPFKFPPPDGYGPVNAANVRPETVIARPDQYVGVTTYSGNVSSGTGTQQIKVGTQPDLVWIKKRFSTNSQHRLVDSVRGPNEELYSDTDQNSGSNNGLNSFDPDGFTVWTSNAGYNELGQDYVAWTWKAGGEVGLGRSFMIDDVGYATASDAGFNPQATEIAPDVGSISTKSGFSIVKYTGSGNDGDGVLHGLSQKPDLVIVKNVDRSSTEWPVWQSGWNANENLQLGSDGSQDLGSPVDGYVGGHTSSNTSITMSNGSTGADNVNRSGDKYMMYSWHNVPGLQKFGSFAGNGDADGPFIELGFRPAIIWVKNYTTTGYNWVVKDSETEKQNPVSDYLLLNSSGNTATGLDVDFLSNGFKLRNSNGNMNRNANNDLYIYCAWAEAPSVNLYGAVSNAR